MRSFWQLELDEYMVCIAYYITRHHFVTKLEDILATYRSMRMTVSDCFVDILKGMSVQCREIRPNPQHSSKHELEIQASDHR